MVPRVLIIEANGIKPPYAVRTGQKLIIPRRRSHTVKTGETGFDIALDYGVSWKEIAQANGLDPKQPVKPGQKLAIPTIARVPEPLPAPSPPTKPGAAKYVWPVAGEVLRKFKPRGEGTSYHDGIDIAGERADPVRTAAAGTVIFAGDGPSEYGRTVIVHHGGRWVTVYSFLDAITVKKGDKLKAGARLGTIGTSGIARTPQLHFELRQARVAVDPLGSLPQRD